MNQAAADQLAIIIAIIIIVCILGLGFEILRLLWERRK